MIQKIFGYVVLHNRKKQVHLTPLKKVFGKKFDVHNNRGSIISDDNHTTLDTLLNDLIDNYHLLKKSKVEDMSIYIILKYKEQANWSVSPEQMNKLSFLNAVLCVTAYEASDE